MLIGTELHISSKERILPQARKTNKLREVVIQLWNIPLYVGILILRPKEQMYIGGLFHQHLMSKTPTNCI